MKNCIEITTEGPIKKQSAIVVNEYNLHGCPVCGNSEGWSMIHIPGAVDRKCAGCGIRFWVVNLDYCDKSKWNILPHPKLESKEPQKINT